MLKIPKKWFSRDVKSELIHFRVLLDYVFNCQPVMGRFTFTRKCDVPQKICEKLTQVNCSRLAYSFRKFVLKTSHTIMIFLPRLWKLADSDFYSINKKRDKLFLLSIRYDMIIINNTRLSLKLFPLISSSKKFNSVKV